MIPEYITRELRNGASLEETLKKYNTNLKELFSSAGETKKKKKKRKKMKKQKRKTEPKYYSYHKKVKKYAVARRIDDKQTYFGCYATEEEAALAVALLNEYGWTQENNWKVRDLVKQITKGEKEL